MSSVMSGGRKKLHYHFLGPTYPGCKEGTYPPAPYPVGTYSLPQDSCQAGIITQGYKETARPTRPRTHCPEVADAVKLTAWSGDKNLSVFPQNTGSSPCAIGHMCR